MMFLALMPSDLSAFLELMQFNDPYFLHLRADAGSMVALAHPFT
jgi:hypothetical protein